MKNKLSIFLLVTLLLIISSGITFGLLPDQALSGVTSADWLSLLVTFICISMSIYCFIKAESHVVR